MWTAPKCTLIFLLIPGIRLPFVGLVESVTKKMIIWFYK